LKQVPLWVYKHDGWVIRFRPIPKSPELRGQAGIRPIGARTTAAWRAGYASSIKSAILKKASQHGEFDVPYVVATDFVSEDQPDLMDVLEALFGKSPWRFVVSEGVAEHGTEGVWLNRREPKYTRLSAVLAFVYLTPWTVSQVDTYIIRNPWAKHRYDGPLGGFPEVSIDACGEVNRKTGISLAEVLDLPTGWPKG